MSSEQHYTFSSESVSEGHPDKVCDFIADSILDACLEQDPHSHVACEVLCKHRHRRARRGDHAPARRSNYEAIARRAMREIGYTDPAEPFNADGVQVLLLLSRQSSEINAGRRPRRPTTRRNRAPATRASCSATPRDESAELMPLPILLAHRLTRGLAEDRRSGRHDWLRPDAQITGLRRLRGNTPHRSRRPSSSPPSTRDTCRGPMSGLRRDASSRRASLGELVLRRDAEFIVNPSGSFVLGGPSADCGVTGPQDHRRQLRRRRPSRRRRLQRQGPVEGGSQRRLLLPLRGAAASCRPASPHAPSSRSPTPSAAPSRSRSRSTPSAPATPQKAEKFVADSFDFRPANIIQELELLQPIYRQTTNYGHFGKAGLPWEKAVVPATV